MTNAERITSLVARVDELQEMWEEAARNALAWRFRAEAAEEALVLIGDIHADWADPVDE